MTRSILSLLQATAIIIYAPVALEAQELEAAPPVTRLFAQDPYTEYALLDDPATASFRILYRPIERTPGATVLINGTRHGSEGGDIEVWDPRTGKPIEFEYIGGEEAIARKVPGRFTPEDHYIVARLPRPVPEGGEGRVVIVKTYKDARTYYADGPDSIVWVRRLSPMRFGVVLPKGYSLDSVDIASQLTTLKDGRLKLSLTNPSGGLSPITIRATKTGTPFKETPVADNVYDDGTTLFDLGDPKSHRFRVEHVSSDGRRGDHATIDVAGYLPLTDIVVVDLDTARLLETTEQGGATVAKLDVPIVDDRQSARLKVTGNVQEEAYRMESGNLVFETTLRGLRNTVLLPEGWEVSYVSQPGTIGRHGARAFVAFINIHAEDAMDLQIRARSRVGD
ncbi:MAG TPA: hypothetical protein VEK15_16730 [Vicinamibacteria bacterium]|nr:hypothetical protein [Vicinamibacteria bacterium]